MLTRIRMMTKRCIPMELTWSSSWGRSSAFPLTMRAICLLADKNVLVITAWKIRISIRAKERSNSASKQACDYALKILNGLFNDTFHAATSLLIPRTRRINFHYPFSGDMPSVGLIEETLSRVIKPLLIMITHMLEKTRHELTRSNYLTSICATILSY